jgi:hypothetical protein
VVGKLVSAPLLPSLTSSLASSLTASGKSGNGIAPEQNPVFSVKPPQKGNPIAVHFGRATKICHATKIMSCDKKYVVRQKICRATKIRPCD